MKLYIKQKQKNFTLKGQTLYTKKSVGCLSVIIGGIVGLSLICLGLYVGFYLMLVCGIADIITQVQTEVSATALAWSIGKIVFFEVPIVIGLWCGILIGGLIGILGAK